MRFHALKLSASCRRRTRAGGGTDHRSCTATLHRVLWRRPSKRPRISPVARWCVPSRGLTNRYSQTKHPREVALPESWFPRALLFSPCSAVRRCSRQPVPV